jgi:hypothetical protein
MGVLQTIEDGKATACSVESARLEPTRVFLEPSGPVHWPSACAIFTRAGPSNPLAHGEAPTRGEGKAAGDP